MGALFAALLLAISIQAPGSAVNYAAGAQPAAIVAGDLNGDGRVDLAFANFSYRFSNGNVTVFLNPAH